MYMPLAEPIVEEPDSPLSQQDNQLQLQDNHQLQLQEDQQLLLTAGRSQHHQRLPLPSGLGIGLARHVHGRSRQGVPSSQRRQQQQQQGEAGQTAPETLEDVVMGGESSSAAADMHASSSAAAAAAAAGGGAGLLYDDADEAAAMAVDGAEGAAAGGMFADAVQIGPADLACEGLGDLGLGGAAAGGGDFIRLQGVQQLGGAFEAVHLPRGGAAGAGDEEDMQQAVGHGLMQLHFNGS
jgi:hypothetical protein